MIPEARQSYDCLVRLTGDLLAAVDGVPDDLLNRELDLPETNTLFQIGNHALGAAGAWIIARAGRQTLIRNRETELGARGSAGDLKDKAEGLLTTSRAVLENLRDGDLESIREPIQAHLSPAGRWTARECVLHALEHLALHVGHAQLTRQLLGVPPGQRQAGHHPMDIHGLMAHHRQINAVLGSRRLEEVTLWYADLGVEVQDEMVSYHCPGCGLRLSSMVDEFITSDTNSELRCDRCRGDREERGGAG